MKIGIVGAGIGGLTAAIALGREHEVTVIERSEFIAAVGAGIVVSANAGRALLELGVDLQGHGRPVSSTTIATAAGRPLQQLDLSVDSDRLGPTIAIARPDLHHLLVDALPDAAVLRLGCTVTGVDAERAVVGLDDGASLEFDLVVGADGIGSQVRKATPTPGRIRPAGLACWRAIVPTASLGEPVEYVGSGQRVGVVGLAVGTYLYLVETASRGQLAGLGPEDVRSRFGGFTEVAPLLADLDQAMRFDDLAELDRPVWGTPKVTLLGDAAHAMTPNLGQGASMAIEDAVVLARSLRNGTTAWFQHYVVERDRRVRWVQLTSRRLGRALDLRAATARRLRDVALRSTPDRIVHRQTERLLGGGPVPPYGT